MNIKELMIGDICHYNIRKDGINEEKTICNVIGLNNTTDEIKIIICNDVKWVNQICIYPIKITEEILNTNGFECIDDYCKWYTINGNIVYDYRFKSLNYLVNGICLPIYKVDYVHQLQQHLRRCRINDNLKI